MMKKQRIRGWLRLLDRRRREEPETAVERMLARIEHEPFFVPRVPLHPGVAVLLSYWLGVLIGGAYGGNFGNGFWIGMGTVIVGVLCWWTERK